MGALDQACTDKFADGILHGEFARDIEPGWQAFLAAMANFQEMRRAEVVAGVVAPSRTVAGGVDLGRIAVINGGYRAHEYDRITGALKKLRCDMTFIFDQT